jgi:hypothetical protein
MGFVRRLGRYHRGRGFGIAGDGTADEHGWTQITVGLTQRRGDAGEERPCSRNRWDGGRLAARVGRHLTACRVNQGVWGEVASTCRRCSIPLRIGCRRKSPAEAGSKMGRRKLIGCRFDSTSLSWVANTGRLKPTNRQSRTPFTANAHRDRRDDRPVRGLAGVQGLHAAVRAGVGDAPRAYDRSVCHESGKQH